MRRLALVPALVALGVALAPSTALAKGASEATITGPGITQPIALAGEGQPHGDALMQIAEAAGFFPSVFQTTPDPMLDAPPQAELGPMYTVTYAMPGPSNERDMLVQELYPYAKPNPITYVPGGQPFWTSEVTHGGWFVAGTTLKNLLVEAGLPETAPPAPELAPSDSPWRVVALAGIFAALGVLAALAIARTRGRVRTA